MARGLWILLLATALGGSTTLAAQEFRAGADAGFSRAQPPAGSGAEPATYLLAGLRALARPSEGPVRLFGGLYGGLALGSGGADWAVLDLGAGWRTALSSRISLDAEAEGSAFTVGRPMSYRALTAEGRPELSFDAGPVELLLRGRAAVGGSRRPGRRLPVTGASLPPGGEHLWLAGGGPGARVSVGDYELTGRLEAFDGALGGYRNGSLELDGGEGPVTWGASVGVWGTPSGSEVAASLRVQVPLGGGWSVFGTGGRSQPDPVLGTPPATFATAVASRRLVTVERENPSLYSVVRFGARPRIRFSLPAPEADSVALAGDFTQWRPVAMRRTDGGWTVEMRVPPGTYHFAFVVDGRWYVPPDAPGRVSDEWGRANATLVVP